MMDLDKKFWFTIIADLILIGCGVGQTAFAIKSLFELDSQY